MKGTWERREDYGGWRGAKRDDRGAGVRLWWVNDLDGFMFVPATEILELRVLGTITNEQSQESAKRRRESSERAEAERDRIDQAKDQAEDTQAQAKFLLAEVEKARREATAMALVDQQKKDDVAKAKRWAELLSRFPPDKWTLETPKEIDKRRTVMHVFPNDDEIEFLKAFDEWKEAWTAWKSAQDAAAAEAPTSAAAKPNAVPTKTTK
jgi:hypothetical protein